MRSCILLVALASFAAACAPLWDRANRIPFQEDVEEVLGATGASIALRDCHMEGTTRTGNCTLAADPSELEAIATALEMGEPHGMDAGEGSLLPAFLLDSPCLDDFSASPLNELLAYLIVGRPDQLRLADGGQFEYLLIIFAPRSEAACIQASYAYG